MYILVHTTTGSGKEAEKIAKALVKERLTACVNYFPTKSTYSWKGKIHCDSEYMLLCKTPKSKFSKIKNKIQELHSYDLPEIISVKIDDADEKYLNWIKQTVK